MKAHPTRVITASAAALLLLAVVVPKVAGPLKAQVSGPESVQVGEIYELQAAFHRAKTTQDLNVMMSLWDPNATLNVQGDPNSPYVGFDQIKAFWQSSGSFTHHRFSLFPSFKTQINVHGDEASLYFECHDVGNFDQATRFIASDTFLSGTLRHISGQWVFSNMTAGRPPRFPSTTTIFRRSSQTSVERLPKFALGVSMKAHPSRMFTALAAALPPTLGCCRPKGCGPADHCRHGPRCRVKSPQALCQL